MGFVEVGKLWCVAQILPSTCFCKQIALSFHVRDVRGCCKGRVESDDSHSPKYLLSGPLQKKFDLPDLEQGFECPLNNWKNNMQFIL